MRVLVVNAGSSSLKLAVVDSDDMVIASRELPVAGGRFDASELEDAVRSFGRVDAVGHRVVHGGRNFTGPVSVDREIVDRLRALADLAPLHQALSLAALEAVSALLPNVPAVACFDTAFHATLPPAAATYAIPTEWRERWAIRRYGFHGLSHAWVSRRTAELVGGPIEDLRIVSCHLGAGASLAAIHGGRSVDTTMGFTPLEGLVMATRSGSVDPGLVLWLELNGGLSPAEVSDALEHRSGLHALARTTDMRQILSKATAGDADSRLALDVYLHRLRAGIAAMAAAMNGLDTLAFTGGVGENAPAIRRGAAGSLGFLGVGVDEERNTQGEGDRRISRDGASVAVLVVRAREDLEIALQVRRALGTGRHGRP